MQHQLIVLHVTCAAIEPLIALTIRPNDTIAEIKPDIFATVIGADPIIPAHGCNIDLCAMAIMADLGSALIEIIVLLSEPIMLKLDLIIQIATIVTWIVD